jgi:hypothetical protein
MHITGFDFEVPTSEPESDRLTALLSIHDLHCNFTLGYILQGSDKIKLN